MAFPRRNKHLRRSFSEDLARMLLVDLCSGVHKMHTHGWLHLDLKADNILACEDGSFKVADFGTARMLSGEVEELSHMVGTYMFMSPEMQ